MRIIKILRWPRDSELYLGLLGLGVIFVLISIIEGINWLFGTRFFRSESTSS